MLRIRIRMMSGIGSLTSGFEGGERKGRERDEGGGGERGRKC